MRILHSLSAVALVSLSCATAFAQKPATFIRTTNTKSDVAFFTTNSGVLFNNDALAGLTWPRGSSNNYLFGEGLWIAAERVKSGVTSKLCELGYNPNSGAGWYAPGEMNPPADGSDSNSKYLTYIGTSFDRATGAPTINNKNTPLYNWPMWAGAGTPGVNFNFGNYVSNVMDRAQLANSGAHPVMLSDEDFINRYTDKNPASNPEFKAGSGYPFGLDITESIFSWGSGRYRDLIFLRYQVKNTTSDTLYDVYLAPAMDPDLGVASNDLNAAVTDSTNVTSALSGNPDYAQYLEHPSKLNMGYQFSQPEAGSEYGMIGFEFVETPIVNVTGDPIDPSDSVALGGYGPGSQYQTNQLGLNTFKKWTLLNDPIDSVHRYNFVSSGVKDGAAGISGDMRVLLSTGPFRMLPGATASATIAIGLAQPSMTNRGANFDSLISLMASAHLFFAREVAQPGNPNAVTIQNFANAPVDGVAPSTSSNGISVSCYPNPAAAGAVLNLSLSEDAVLTAGIYDVTGREVRRIVTGARYSHGAYRIPLDTKDLPSGSYIVRFTSAKGESHVPVVVEH